MSALNNDYLIEQLANQGFSESENIFIPASAPTTQQPAGPVKGQFHRIVANGTSGASLMLKSILSNDNPGMVWLVNDSANNVSVFPFKNFAGGATDTGESMNGVANASFSVTAGNAAIFIASLVHPKRKGGTSGSTPSLNWSAALLT
jgi:hypothetical protein